MRKNTIKAYKIIGKLKLILKESTQILVTGSVLRKILLMKNKIISLKMLLRSNKLSNSLILPISQRVERKKIHP